MKIDISDKQNVLYVDQDQRAGVKLGVQILDDKNIAAGGRNFQVMEEGKMIFEGDTDASGMAEVTLVFNLRDEVRKNVQFVLDGVAKEKVVVLDKSDPKIASEEEETAVGEEFKRLMEEPNDGGIALFVQKYERKYSNLADTLRQRLAEDKKAAAEIKKHTIINPDAGNGLRILMAHTRQGDKYSLFRRNTQVGQWFDGIHVPDNGDTYIVVLKEIDDDGDIERTCALLSNAGEICSKWREAIRSYDGENFIVTEENESWFCDKRDKRTSEIYTGKIKRIKPGVFIACRNGKYVLLRGNGEEFSDLYNHIEAFEGGYRVTRGSKNCVLDDTGKEVSQWHSCIQVRGGDKIVVTDNFESYGLFSLSERRITGWSSECWTWD